MTKKHTARCACGAVTFEFDTDPELIAMCHCRDCKKAGGGEAAIVLAVPETDLTVTGGQTKSFHYVADSGQGLDRNFCPDCGSRLFSNHLEGFPGLVFVTLSSLDDSAGIVPKMEMFTRHRPSWVKPLDIPQFETMPG